MQRDLGTERLTYRRFRVLVSHLPRESHYVQAVAGEVARWGISEHLMASVIDSLVQLNHNFVQSKSKTRLQKPKLVTRPGAAKAKPNGRTIKGGRYSMAEMRKLLDEQG